MVTLKNLGHRRPIKILLADDEPSVRQMVERRLEANGYQVITASDGQQALDLARTEHPDMILMDVMMPNLSGDMAASELQLDSRTSSIPIVFLTCLVKAEEARAADYVIGNNRVLSKPIESSRLISMIEDCMGQ